MTHAVKEHCLAGDAVVDDISHLERCKVLDVRLLTVFLEVIHSLVNVHSVDSLTAGLLHGQYLLKS